MRPLKVHVSGGNGDKVLKLCKKFEAKNVSLVNGRNAEGELEIIALTLSNNRLEDFISEVTELQGTEITFYPHGVMALYPPAEEAPDQVLDVELRSPIEIFLSGLQSIGSWQGFITYTLISSVVVWIGLFTNTTYLLVAAMLIAPFAGPAMNTAIATARGDIKLLGRSVLRYFISIFLMVGATALLSLIMKQEIATALMVERSQVSSVVALLAIAAGAAGAVNLIQSERDSLVSGAAVGMLVAASLAPPAGITGMAIALAKWDLVTSGVFLLFLQLLGINFSGALVFKLAGLNTKGARYNRGKKKVYFASLVLTTLLLAVIIYWQFNSVPELQRSSISKRAEAIIKETINTNDEVELIEANARFTRAEIAGQNTLLCQIYLQNMETEKESGELKDRLGKEISRNIKSKYNDVTPVISIIILEKEE